MGLIRDIATSGMSRFVDSMNSKKRQAAGGGTVSTDDPGEPGYLPPKRSSSDTSGGSFGQDVVSGLKRRAARKRE